MNPKDFKLSEAKPRDRPHLLLWDKFDGLDLRSLSFHYNAQVISYRENLLSRLPPQSQFLALHQGIDRELGEIRNICKIATKDIVILRDLDCLITYLYTQPEAPITLFWKNLSGIRHLESILWILLPSKLAPSLWAENRLYRP